MVHESMNSSSHTHLLLVFLICLKFPLLIASNYTLCNADGLYGGSEKFSKHSQIYFIFTRPQLDQRPDTVIKGTLASLHERETERRIAGSCLGGKSD